MCGRTGMSWRRRSTPGSRTGSRGGDDRVCLRRGEGLRSFQGGRETWKTASWQPAGSRIRLPLKESDIPVAVNPKSAHGSSNNPQCGFWDSQFSAAQVKSVEQPCTKYEVAGTDFFNQRYSPDRLHKPRDQIDITYDFDFSFLKETSDRLAKVDRRSALKAIFDKLTRSAKTDTERHLAVLGFLQKAAFHSSWMQPMYEDKQAVLDPLVLLELGTMRCGGVARVGADIFEA